MGWTSISFTFVRNMNCVTADRHARMAWLSHRAAQDYRSTYQSYGYGGSASDAFHLVIPSLPGFGFSARPTNPGWGPERTATAWVVLMKRLGYAQFVAQGGDLGAGICTVMAKHAPPELLGIHTNFPGLFHPTLRGRSSVAILRHLAYPPTKDVPTSS